jgi:Vacuolar protein sorting-associated protein 26
MYLTPYDLTPTYRNVHNKFSVRYSLNLVLVDQVSRVFGALAAKLEQASLRPAPQLTGFAMRCRLAPKCATRTAGGPAVLQAAGDRAVSGGGGGGRLWGRRTVAADAITRTLPNTRGQSSPRLGA